MGDSMNVPTLSGGPSSYHADCFRCGRPLVAFLPEFYCRDCGITITVQWQWTGQEVKASA
jgi:hypothetical protein